MIYNLVMLKLFRVLFAVATILTIGATFTKFDWGRASILDAILVSAPPVLLLYLYGEFYSYVKRYGK